MRMTHTPGRVEVIYERDLWIGKVLIAEVTDTAEGLEGSDSEADANAARLALCWNCHDELVAALEAALECNGHTPRCREIQSSLHEPGCHAVCEQIRAALAKTKES